MTLPKNKQHYLHGAAYFGICQNGSCHDCRERAKGSKLNRSDFKLLKYALRRAIDDATEYPEVDNLKRALWKLRALEKSL